LFNPRNLYAPWGNEDTQQILDILADHNIKVTFFVSGNWVRSFPDDVKRIQAAGHELGNHGSNHKEMSKLSTKERKKELMDVHKQVEELTGVEMRLFRAPYSDYQNEVVTDVKSFGYYPVEGNVDSQDWKDYGAESIVTTVCNNKNLHNGAIIICHNGAKYTPLALSATIKNLQKQGYELVTISELIYKKNYYLDANGRQISDKKS
jgi:peptidoglycan/xylan/chitin deacetylase (PgdA/CDA1 family)